MKNEGIDLKERALVESIKHQAGASGGFSFGGERPEGVTVARPLPRGISFPNGAKSAILITFDVEANYGNGKGDPAREIENYNRICDRFYSHRIAGTFNIVGKMAEELGPGFVQKIGGTGNEIASHGAIHELNHRYGGDRVYAGHYGKQENREQVEEGVRILNQIIPGSVQGIRLPYAHWNEYSYDAMEAIGLKWASHLGIDDYRVPGQGFGGQPFRIQIGDHHYPIVEIPLDTQTFDWAIWMADETSNRNFVQAVQGYCDQHQISFERTPKGALAIWRSRVENAIRDQSVFTLLAHPINFTVMSSGWRDPVEEFMLPFIDEMGKLHQEGKIWVCRSCELADFYLKWEQEQK